MDKNAIKKFAVWARRELISRVSQKAVQYGITEESFGDPNADSVNGRVLSGAEKAQRQRLIQKIKAEDYRQVMEEVAYTWFNRFIALRFMEVNGYLPSHVRVFTDDQGAFKPQILAEAIHLDLDGLDMEKVYAFKEANQIDELYKYLLIVQCNALNPILPGMFQRIEDYTELLFPDNLLREGSVIDRMVRQGDSDSISESDWTDQVQIIGWLYQYYNTEPKDQVFADLKKNIKITKEKIPAATQLFTPDWIVRYMVENSLGRLWVEGHPAAGEKFLPVHNEDGSVRKEDGKWNYYLEEAPQEPEVEVQLAEIRREYAALTPEEIRVIDPCCGSGHILCYLFDVLEQIYEDYGYPAREAAQKIVQHNLHGLDIDPRAVQLSYFAVMMKARQYDRRFFSRNIQPMVYSPEGYPEGMEYGSLITVDELEPAPDFDNWTLHDGDYAAALNRWSFRYVLHQKYDVVVTNPPYMGAGSISPPLMKYIKENYFQGRTDLFAVFIKKCRALVKRSGLFSMITMHAWMFQSSFISLREDLSNNTLITLIHLGTNAFDDQNGEVVQTVAFVFADSSIDSYKATCIDVTGHDSPEKKNKACLRRSPKFHFSIQRSMNLPGKQYAYWISDAVEKVFLEAKPLSAIGKARRGLQTGDAPRFIRFWYEINYSELTLPDKFVDRHDVKWVLENNGGPVRKWYNSIANAVLWYRNGSEIKQCPSSIIPSEELYFGKCITWNKITTKGLALKLQQAGIIPGDLSPFFIANNEEDFLYCFALLNSCVAPHMMKALNPTITTPTGDVSDFPVVRNAEYLSRISDLVNSCVEVSRMDSAAFEDSWEFNAHPLVELRLSGAYMWGDSAPVMNVQSAYNTWKNYCEGRFEKLKANEKELNRIFIDIYGLQDELTPEVEDKDVTVRKADLGRDIRSFISYAVGCMFGRYSIYKEGLIYAGGTWDYNQYENFAWAAEGKPELLQFHTAGTHFFPDQDNIIPITDDEYFRDDIANRFMEFVSVVYGSDTLEENLRFIADALGGKGSPRDVIRNYFLNDFYADHLKVYQKRPIYWLFDSGKKNGFKCLIYMHRYQPDTIARIRTDYVHELQGRYRTAIADLERRMASASTAERVRLSKQLAKLQDQAEELRTYEEKIHHLADQMISINLDDGVKVNYAKFQDVLAKIK